MAGAYPSNSYLLSGKTYGDNNMIATLGHDPAAAERASTSLDKVP